MKRVGKDGSVLIAESEEVAKLIVGKLEDAEARVEDLVVENQKKSENS